MFKNERDKKHFVNNFARNHGTSRDEVRDILENNPKNYAKDLDKLAFSNVKATSKSKKDVLDNLTEKNMRYIPTKPSIFNNIRSRKIGKRQSGGDILTETLHMDEQKKQGKNLYGMGATTDFGHSKADASKASFTTKIVDSARHLNPLGASTKESFLQSMGIATKENKILASKGYSKLSTNFMIPAFGAMMAYTSLDAEDPFAEYASGVLGGTGMVQGWRSGRGLGGALLGGSHKARILGGVLGGGALMAAPVAAIAAQNDLFKNDSFIGKQAKKLYTNEKYTGLQETRESLTMRQAGLKKLSSSHLNNREQLLGNEAQILRMSNQ